MPNRIRRGMKIRISGLWPFACAEVVTSVTVFRLMVHGSVRWLPVSHVGTRHRGAPRAGQDPSQLLPGPLHSDAADHRRNMPAAAGLPGPRCSGVFGPGPPGWCVPWPRHRLAAALHPRLSRGGGHCLWPRGDLPRCSESKPSFFVCELPSGSGSCGAIPPRAARLTIPPRHRWREGCFGHRPPDSAAVALGEGRPGCDAVMRRAQGPGPAAPHRVRLSWLPDGSALTPRSEPPSAGAACPAARGRR
jgi:hypothetical protein